MLNRVNKEQLMTDIIGEKLKTEESKSANWEKHVFMNNVGEPLKT